VPATASPKRGRPPTGAPRKATALVRLALALVRGQALTIDQISDQYDLPRRTVERYLQTLRATGLPMTRRFVGERQVAFAVADARPGGSPAGGQAVDVADDDARALTLLGVAAALLPQNLGIRESLERTVKAALRVRGMSASTTLKKWENLVLVLENNAKNHHGAAPRFAEMMDAAVQGDVVRMEYRSPKRGATVETFWPAGFGLYRGGLYVLAVPVGDDGTRATWLAFERIEGSLRREPRPRLGAGVRARALREAGARWGPSPAPHGDREVVVTMRFSTSAAPYVRARPWHAHMELAVQPDDTLLAGLRLKGETAQFESWVKSWGREVQVLRPRWLAERIADDLEAAASAHRDAARQFDSDS
jgi:predicted DNA-binding transcriptional regulator YafY